MMRMIFVLVTLLFPLPAVGHPHIFVDTGLRAIFDNAGRLTHVEVTWRYDAFYSLLITEDMGLDSDYDGALTETEAAQLTGFDMQWIDGFNGDLVLLQAGRPLALSGPKDPTARLEDGQIVTTHRRAVVKPPIARDAPLSFKAFDPTYYTAYELNLPVEDLADVGCRARVKMPVMNAELSNLQAELSALDAQTDPEDVGLPPNIGEALAAEMVITCAAS